MVFVDRVEIFVKAGRGGDGCVSFHREKFITKGGPDGGDGGRGGSVILKATHHLTTLYDFRHQVHYGAQDGQRGQGNNSAGASANDLVIRVPVGTVTKDRETGIVLKDLTEDGQEVVIARGGRGGRGNWSFKSSTHQTPLEFELGRPGPSLWLMLELKLIADVGLVGRPNAGKSTLLSRVSAAKPKIADYPFTTLQPVLGIVTLGEFHTAVFADIPGLIEGAHEGHGLGDWFLRHVERTRLLLHLVDMAPMDGVQPLAAYREIMKELKAYSPEVAKKRQLVIATKMDVPEAAASLAAFRKSLPKSAVLIPVSAATGQGLKELLAAVAKALAAPPSTTGKKKATIRPPLKGARPWPSSRSSSSSGPRPSPGRTPPRTP